MAREAAERAKVEARVAVAREAVERAKVEVKAAEARAEEEARVAPVARGKSDGRITEGE